VLIRSTRSLVIVAACRHQCVRPRRAACDIMGAAAAGGA
jgi:hypothetical protein